MLTDERIYEAVRYFADGDVDMADYEVIRSGEESIVVRCPEPRHEVIKLPRNAIGHDARSRAGFEWYCLEALDSVPTPPPLAIPSIIECNDDVAPYWLAMRPLPGTVLDLPIAYGLSTAEHEVLGKKVGQFAAWLADSLSQETYDGILRNAGHSRELIVGREKFIQQRAGGRGNNWLAQNGYPALENTLGINYQQYLEFRRDGRLERTIIGHDDLDIRNVMMVESLPAGWLPAAIIDFGLVKPSSPERELRHMWLLSEAAGLAAKAGYEEVAGIKLDEGLLAFWAVGQLVTNADWHVRQPTLFRGPQHLATIGRMLQRLVPEEDFAELICFENQPATPKFS